MVHPGLAALGSVTSVAVIGTVMSNLAGTDYWYDIYNKYIKFGPELTKVIDYILMTNQRYVKLGPTIFSPGGQYIPGEGYHYFYYYPSEERTVFQHQGLIIANMYIGLHKIKETKGNSDVYYYIGWIGPDSDGEKVIKFFTNKVLSPLSETIRVISIDTSRFEPSLLWLSQICKTPKQNQIQAMDHILENWDESRNHNLKVFLYGKRGVGKTYTSMLIKRKIEKEVPGCFIRLYEDFNPSSIGVNINSLILSHASASTPVVFIINEVDEYYKKTMENEVKHDTRLQHTENKSTFNNMLDNIGKFKYVIAIYTSEIDPKTIIEEESEEEKKRAYKSFMRKGRVDLFLEMTEESTKVRDQSIFF